MISKHFFKTLFLFTGIILLGLLGVLLINYFDKQNVKDVEQTQETDTKSTTKTQETKTKKPVAK